MRQLTVEEFSANIHEYIGKDEVKQLEILENGVTTIVTFVQKKPVDHVQIFQDVVGTIDLPDDFDFKKFMSDSLWEDYENLN
ncbi:MAG: hypothetical protein FWD97_07390 [Defluviitaleaceae bacterium]|nr:hypothetical protein [Defluviitaleaceae bacterium]